MTKAKSITDPLLIAGLFREAFFQTRPIVIKQRDASFEAQIKEVKESTTKNAREQRYLHLDYRGIEEVTEGEDCSLQCAFSQFLAEWKGKVKATDSELVTEIPKEMSIHNHRTHGRIKPMHSKITIPLLVQTGSLHGIEFLEVEDVSKTGLGGIIHSNSGIPFTADTHVSGEWHGAVGVIKINGSMSQIRLLEQSNKDGPSVYRIGISLKRTNSTAQDSSQSQSKRKYSRLAANHVIHMLSPLHPKYQISLRLKDVSAAGFSAELADPADRQLLVLGGALRLKNSTLLAELVDVNEHVLRFQIVEGSAEDRIRWLRETVTSANSNTHSSTPIGSDLIDLFCEAGAVSSQYIKNQAKIFESLSKDLSSDGIDDSWIHRWVEKSASGSIRGHICSVRISDNCWHVGEVAGSTQRELKISSTFIPGFLNGFREFCLSATPCQKILLGWNSGHPRWREYEEYLSKQSEEFVLGKFKTRYHRIPTEYKDSHQVECWTYQSLPASDWSAINEKLRKAKSTHARAALQAFDFSKENFSSPALRKTIRESGENFRREYGIIRHASSSNEILVIFHSFPLRASINQTLNVPWAVHLVDAPEELEPLSIGSLEKLKRVGISKGFYFPGVLEVLEDDTSDELGASKTMLWHVGHPNMLAYFKDKK